MAKILKTRITTDKDSKKVIYNTNIPISIKKTKYFVVEYKEDLN